MHLLPYPYESCEVLFRSNLKMADLSPFLFAQIDKIFDKFGHPDEYLQHQCIFVSDNLHMH